MKSLPSLKTKRKFFHQDFTFAYQHQFFSHHSFKKLKRCTEQVPWENVLKLNFKNMNKFLLDPILKVWRTRCRIMHDFDFDPATLTDLKLKWIDNAPFFSTFLFLDSQTLPWVNKVPLSKSNRFIDINQSSQLH